MPARHRILIHEIDRLLTPSGMSAVLTVTFSLILSVGTIFLNRYRSSFVQLQSLSADHSSRLSYVTGSIVQNHIVQNLPEIIFWALVGIIVYLIASDIVSIVNSTIEVKKELAYVHSQRKSLIEELITPIIIRVAVVGVWLPYLIVFFHKILPYALSVAIKATSASSTIAVIGDILLSVFVISITIHVHVILLRLMFLKSRLLAKAIAE